MEPPTRTIWRRDYRIRNKGWQGSTYLINILLLEVSVLQNLLHGFYGPAEEVHVELLELGPGQGLGEVVAALEGLDFDASGLLAGECPLGLLDFALELTEGLEVASDVGAGLLLVLLDEVVHDTVVKVLTTKVGVTGGGQDLEDTVVDREERDIEGSASEIEDEDVPLSF